MIASLAPINALVMVPILGCELKMYLDEMQLRKVKLNCIKIKVKEESKNVFAQNGKSVEMQNQYWPAEKTDGRSKS